MVATLNRFAIFFLHYEFMKWSGEVSVLSKTIYLMIACGCIFWWKREWIFLCVFVCWTLLWITGYIFWWSYECSSTSYFSRINLWFSSWTGKRGCCSASHSCCCSISIWTEVSYSYSKSILSCRTETLFNMKIKKKNLCSSGLMTSWLHFPRFTAAAGIGNPLKFEFLLWVREYLQPS